MKFALLFSAILLAVGACQSEDEPGNLQTWWINSTQVDCTGIAPQSCLQVYKGDTLKPDSWEFFYDKIEGFDFEPGYLYALRVRITDRPEPVPADASSKIYTLKEILSKDVDQRMQLSKSWKVLEVGSIKNPVNSRDQQALKFEFDVSKRFYFGDMGCNSVRGTILKLDQENLHLGPGSATLMACENMQTEKAIGEALIQTRTYRLDGRELSFFDQGGTELIRFLAMD